MGDYDAYGPRKVVVESRCPNSKHVTYMSLARLTVTAAACRCKVCLNQGSSYDRLAYHIWDDLQAIEAYAVEAHAVTDEMLPAGNPVSVSRHRFDLMMIKPAKILGEVQGEGHSSKPIIRPQSIDSSLHSRVQRDYELADAATAAGYSIIWYIPGDESTRLQRWRDKTLEAIADQQASEPPKLYVA